MLCEGNLPILANSYQLKSVIQLNTYIYINIIKKKKQLYIQYK